MRNRTQVYAYCLSKMMSNLYSFCVWYRHASELFSELAPILSDLTCYLEDLSWVNANAFQQSQLVSLTC